MELEERGQTDLNWRFLLRPRTLEAIDLRKKLLAALAGVCLILIAIPLILSVGASVATPDPGPTSSGFSGEPFKPMSTNRPWNHDWNKLMVVSVYEKSNLTLFVETVSLEDGSDERESCHFDLPEVTLTFDLEHTFALALGTVLEERPFVCISLIFKLVSCFTFDPDDKVWIQEPIPKDWVDETKDQTMMTKKTSLSAVNINQTSWWLSGLGDKHSDSFLYSSRSGWSHFVDMIQLGVESVALVKRNSTHFIWVHLRGTIQKTTEIFSFNMITEHWLLLVKLDIVTTNAGLVKYPNGDLHLVLLHGADAHDTQVESTLLDLATLSSRPGPILDSHSFLGTVQYHSSFIAFQRFDYKDDASAKIWIFDANTETFVDMVNKDLTNYCGQGQFDCGLGMLGKFFSKTAFLIPQSMMICD